MNIPLPIACPDDLATLKDSPEGLLCAHCSRLFPIVDGVPQLLSHELEMESSSEKLQMHAYGRTFSSHSDRRWRRSMGSLINVFGNGYLYSWASKVLESGSDGRQLTILDAGCGDGILRRYLCPRHTYAGVDFSMRPLLRAKRNPGIYLRAGLSHLPFPQNTFDVAVSLQALQYVPRPEDCLIQIARVLKPGGKLLLSVPNGESFKYKRKRNPEIQIQRFDRHSVPALLANEFQLINMQAKGAWIPLPLISIHIPGTYSATHGLSWAAAAISKR